LTGANAPLILAIGSIARARWSFARDADSVIVGAAAHACAAAHRLEAIRNRIARFTA
jgi:hypothetical protein